MKNRYEESAGVGKDALELEGVRPATIDTTV